MIDILIPTFNREKDLLKNIEHIEKLCCEENVIDKYQLLISDNFSTDNTFEKLKTVKQNSRLKIKIYQQNENIGLEKNAIFLLSNAESKYIMYLGDDDYLPEGYLKYIVETISNDDATAAIIPGGAALFADGRTCVARTNKFFDQKKYSSSFKTLIKVSLFGHQLSGLLLKREGLYDKYTEKPNLRNIYPFIFFLGYNCLRGNVYYAPIFRVLISVDNSKDWKYDDSGLLTEIFQNYQIIYPSLGLKYTMACISFIVKQCWRLRLSWRNPLLTYKSFFHLLNSSKVGVLVKFALFFVYPYFYFKKAAAGVKRRFL
jgi:glycosyltransferase involved in cell wall biosynthesis